MRRKNTIVLLLVTFLMTSAFSDVIKSTPQETRTVYSVTYGDLRVDIKAPYQTYPGHKITITVTAEAEAGVDVAKLEVRIYGLRNEREEVHLTTITHLSQIHLDSGVLRQDDYEVMTPSDISPGLTYGQITLEILYYSKHIYLFTATYVRNKAYENTRNLMYIFFITTIVFIATTVYFAIRKPKVEPELKPI